LRPILHPKLVNGRFGDPALYVEMQFEAQAILFDLGDISSLPTRKIHRLEHIFVSHAHIDHFYGFDRLLRILVGRDKTLSLYGPKEFIDQVGHKLQAYRWNLADRYDCDLVFIVSEVVSAEEIRTTRFRLSRAFSPEMGEQRRIDQGVIHDEPAFRVRTAILEHRTPCLAFAIQESVHVNIWKNRLVELGLPVGPWLRQLKRLVLENQPDEVAVRIDDGSNNRTLPLGLLRSAIRLTPGQKIGYVTDVDDTSSNRALIIELVRHSDILFIEAPFAIADAGLAAQRAHLTTAAAGEIARAAEARRVEPFHFSPRYEGKEKEMMGEVMEAYCRRISPSRDLARD
jgi:ribonuclease Z